MQGVSYDQTGADTTFTMHGAPNVSIGYMTTGDKTRVQSVVTDNRATETNNYDIEGRISDYTLTIAWRPNNPMQTSYLYDTLNRLTEVRYPTAYGMAGSPRRTVDVSYDETSRLKQLNVDNQIQMNQIVYNPMSQVTSLTTGAATANPDVENYTYDQPTGLLTNQTVVRATTNQTLLNLSYNYNRGNSNGTLNGKTGQLTNIVNNLDRNKDRVYEFDTLGRLKVARGGAAAGGGAVTANWTESYFYDRYGNKQGTTAGGITANSQAVPSDGLSNQSYDAPSNRINTAGYQYDLAGNLARGQDAAGNWQLYEYDAAGKLTRIKTDSGTILETYVYGADRHRLINLTASGSTYYVWGGASVMEEYTEPTGGNTPTYSKSYIYAGSRLLSTYTNNNGAETLQLQHPDRLGTKLVTTPSNATQFEQATLPFGTSLDAETTGTTNQRFTSYDRSSVSNLDYAVNRSYSSGQSRFISVDPIGASATEMGNPQSNNLYAYVENNPIDFVDPSGLNMNAYPYDPMGISYYLDGVLSDARTVWGAINAGAAWIDFENVAGLDVASFGSWQNDKWVRDHQNIWVSSQALPDYINEVYEGKLGENLTKCINKVFSKPVKVTKNGRTFEMKGSNVIGPQTKKNAPKVDDTSYSSFVLGGGMKGHEAYGRYWAEYNTLFLANDIELATGNVGKNTITVSAKELKQRTYIHELGNHLSDLITKGDPSYFGDPKGVPHEFNPEWKPDFDTGAKLESCVFGSQRP